MITEAQALDKLRAAVESASQATIADELGISPQYLNDVLRGRRGPAPVLERFGYRRVVRYEVAT